MDANLFVGTWRLLSYQSKDAEGRVIHPFGQDAQGILTYAAYGYMCVAIMDPHRLAFTSGNAFASTEQERAAAGERYASYGGRYEVAEDKILHHVEVSLIPNWIGLTQERRYSFEEDRLTLSAGQGSLIWERAKKE